MTSYDDINKVYEKLNSGVDKAESGLIYTCNCGWLDLMRGDRLARFPDGATGYRVTFREQMPVPHTGLTTGVTKSVLVRRGLTTMAQTQRALRPRGLLPGRQTP